MGRTCAICGKAIYKQDLCNQCFKTWCKGKVYPLWVKELIKIQHGFEVNQSSRESTFSDVGELRIESIIE